MTMTDIQRQAAEGGYSLSEAVDAQVRAHAGASGVVMLLDGRDAFAARARLADAAERTLDIQCYIWRNDRSGNLMFDALRRAADRGVQVRLLLDDNNTQGIDGLLAELETHANISVRLFNPFRRRRFRVIEYLTEFSRVNRRMHNKAFTADGKATIVGGRNVGDEYFNEAEGMLFLDLDVLAVGPVATDVQVNFERYWASPMAVPLSRALRSRIVEQRPPTPEPDDSQSPFVRALLAGTLEMEWTTVTMVSDDPAKASGRQPHKGNVWPRISALLGSPRRSLDLVSPYFVPGGRSMRYFAELARHQVRVSVLTNALESTDVAAVHAGYVKRRRGLLRAGVLLYELKRSAALPAPRHQRYMARGSSHSSLHAKTFAVDGIRAFVGSLNFDPRSARLNTEMGFVIESPAIAGAIAEAFITRVPESAYRVRYHRYRGLHWQERGPDGDTIHTREPGAGLLRRAFVRVVSWLPVDWLL